jgi:hypothetical protein
MRMSKYLKNILNFTLLNKAATSIGDIGKTMIPK